MSCTNFVSEFKVTVLSAPVAAGTSDVVPTHGVDMAGYDAVTFMFSFGTITSTAVTSVKAQSSSDDAVADAYVDIAGTSLAVADTLSNTVALLEIIRPPDRWVLPVIDRGTANAVVNNIIAIQYRMHGSTTAPVTQPATVGASKIVVAPIEGTA
jgi:hypothetical protein